MIKTKAQVKKPSPRTTNKAKKYDKYANASGLFFSLALDMTWKLAIVVLVPVVLGSFIDNHYKVKGNVYLFFGLILGFILSFIVIRTTVVQSNQITKEIKDRVK